MSGFHTRERVKNQWANKDKLREVKGVNRVAGLVGRGKEPAVDPRDHQSAPLSTLKDPSTFAPPPKHIAYHGSGASPTATSPARLGASAPQSPAQPQRDSDVYAQEEPPAPPVPYRVNTTGLSTDALPKPPTRRPGPDELRAGSGSGSPVRQNTPALPPRLPSRPSAGGQSPSSLPPTYGAATTEQSQPSWQANQGAMSRLGKSGVSVPGLNIGSGTESPLTGAASSQEPTPASAGGNPQLSELQSRFSKMSSPSAKGDSPGQGTSMEQKQAALKTATSFRNNPSSISMSDARDAASTANNFRQRHGAQVAQGVQSANSLNQKYGISDRMGKINGNAPAQAQPGPSAGSPPAVPQSPSAASKKPPPPPPPKKSSLQAAAVSSSSPPPPPPVPMASKPKPT